MVLSSITQPVTNIAKSVLTNSVVAYKFCSRTISVGYTDYLTPGVSVVAKGTFALISNKTVQALLLLGLAAGNAKNGYKVYKAYSAKQQSGPDDIATKRQALKDAKKEVERLKEELEQLRKATNPDKTAIGAAEVDLGNAESQVTSAQIRLTTALAAISKTTLAKSLAPHVAGVVACVAAAAFAVLR